MARQLKRVDCRAVQGDGAYMVIKPLTFAERKVGVNVDDLLMRVVEWNWTDWDDQPLPLPHDEASRELLTDQEIECILAQFGLVFKSNETGPN